MENGRCLNFSSCLNCPGHSSRDTTKETSDILIPGPKMYGGVDDSCNLDPHIWDWNVSSVILKHTSLNLPRDGRHQRTDKDQSGYILT